MKNILKRAVAAMLLAAPFAFTSVSAEDYMLRAKEGKTRGKIKLENGKNFGYWKGTGSGAIWTINVTNPGKAQLSALIAVPKGLGGDVKAFLNGEEVATKTAEVTGNWQKYKPVNFGNINLAEGENTITIINDNIKGSYFANMKGVELQSDDVTLEVISAN